MRRFDSPRRVQFNRVMKLAAFELGDGEPRWWSPSSASRSHAATTASAEDASPGSVSGFTFDLGAR
ncbi:MAG TPA: hypothetical protein VF989_08700 [Polyangiaceae bacterium]